MPRPSQVTFKLRTLVTVSRLHHGPCHHLDRSLRITFRHRNRETVYDMTDANKIHFPIIFITGPIWQLIVNQFNSDLADFITQHCKPRLLANIDPRKMKLFSWGQDICMYLRYPAILNRPRAHVSTWPDTCPNGNRRGLQVRIGFGSLHKNFEVCALQFQPEQSQSLSWI